eukprot:765236-Hanusia_phi.AAC.3
MTGARRPGPPQSGLSHSDGPIPGRRSPCADDDHRPRQFESFRTSPIVPELPAPDSIIKEETGRQGMREDHGDQEERRREEGADARG